LHLATVLCERNLRSTGICSFLLPAKLGRDAGKTGRGVVKWLQQTLGDGTGVGSLMAEQQSTLYDLLSASWMEGRCLGRDFAFGKLSHWQAFSGRNPCQTWKLFAACSETIDCQKRRPGQKHNLRAMVAQILHTSGISALQSSSGRHAATPVAQLTSPPKRVHHFASPSQRPLRAHNVRLHAVMAPQVRSSCGSVV